MRIVVAVFYVCMVVITAAGMNASTREQFPTLHTDDRKARQTFAVSILFGLLPPSWLVVPFFTGFYQDGFTLEYRGTDTTGQRKR